MHYWRREYFNSLKDVGAKARQTPRWREYAAFCDSYEQGLRREAFAILERFISSMEPAPSMERRRFVSWLLQEADQREGRHMLVPHPLQIRLIEPTLLEWIMEEPACAEPHLWLGGYEHLKFALQLEPQNQLARKKLVMAVLSRVVMNGHEIPIGYLGDAENDLAALKEAYELSMGLLDEDDRLGLAADIEQQRGRIKEFLRKR